MTRTADGAIAVADAVRAVNRATLSATRTRHGLPALPEAQIAVLRALRSGPATPAALADRLALARPTVSNLLRDMESDGLVSRERSEVDRRSVTLTATQQARHLQDVFHRGRGEVVAAAWASLDENDRAALTAATPALRRLADLLHEGTHRPAAKSGAAS